MNGGGGEEGKETLQGKKGTEEREKNAAVPQPGALVPSILFVSPTLPWRTGCAKGKERGRGKKEEGAEPPVVNHTTFTLTT